MKRILSAVSVLLAAILLISSALTVHAEDDPPSPPYTVLGDIDQDGEINIIDASMLQYFIAELNELSNDAVLRADANLDGGTSSVLWYEGSYRNTLPLLYFPRPVPDAFLVLAKEG